MSAETQHPMREIRIEKVVVNIGTGEGGEELQKAERVLEMVTGQTPVRNLAQKTSRDFGVRKGTPIGAKVTLRGEDARSFLETAFWVRNNVIPEYSFDDEGNLNLGIPDYTDFPDHRYDPDIGIFGMDVAVVLERPGYRLKRRRMNPQRVPDRHRIGRGEAMDWIESNFDVEVI